MDVAGVDAYAGKYLGVVFGKFEIALAVVQASRQCHHTMDSLFAGAADDCGHFLCREFVGRKMAV